MRQPALLVAADVFGITSELREFSRQYDAETLLLSPHGAVAFAEEQAGYAAFMAGGGVAAYAEGLRAALTTRTPPFDLAIGFSAGASALWLCLANAQIEPCLPHSALLYYGSRIREHERLAPRRRVHLIFAEHEASFDPTPLAARLCARNIPAEVLPGAAHGFMNPLSPGYDADLCTRETRRIHGLLQPSRK